MKVFKFGGASVKDAEGVKNIVKVLNDVDYQDLLIVVSAMGKMTNAFEKIADAYFYKKEELPVFIKVVRDYHYDIVNELFENKEHDVYSEIQNLFIGLTGFMIQNKSTDFNFVYDQIVSVAELISTKIVSFYLNISAIENTWLDVRECIKTNSDFRDAKVDWKLTEKSIVTKVNPQILYITQGFIAANEHGNTTTLGREGSDYSAGIFAYCLNADSLTIWKDVEGVLNADPRYFNETQLLEQISYTEAIELAFYGASVIHPKTLQPLQNKGIPLLVKSFLNPKKKGTHVSDGKRLVPETPCFIVKKNQLFLSISALDFSFVVEHNISEIFNLFHRYKMKVNLIQNSAISFSICLEDNFNLIKNLLAELSNTYKVVCFANVSLFTVRHFQNKDIEELEKNNKVLLKQLTQETVQIVVQ
ncbi:aspartate kinase [Aureibaculum sp. A20]|uniref:Aspartokinase n=1 Tax=Aureibaculum flavum TaxID=2795986 RepID=A0ABS0WVH4_9FLAO|nr:aspartate kinase [Aureibaculum flavum]MBJ2175995.1 aspartate kinase [Aureibaculum flavum]